MENKRTRSFVYYSLFALLLIAFLLVSSSLLYHIRADENPPDPEHNGSVIPGAYVYGMSSNSILYYAFVDNYDSDKNGIKEELLNVYVYNSFRYQGHVSTALYEKATNSVFLSGSGTYFTASGSVPAIGVTSAYLSSTGWAYAKLTIYQNNNGTRGSVLKAGNWGTIPAFTIYIPGGSIPPPPPPPPADTTPPVISLVNVSNITQSSATVTWNTNESATSKIEWGLNSSYGTSYSKLDGGTSHTMAIPGSASYTVNSGTTYHFRVASTDGAGNSATSSDYTFTTLSESSTPPPDTGGTTNDTSDTSDGSDTTTVSTAPTYLPGTSAGTGQAPISVTSSAIKPSGKLSYSIISNKVTLTWKASSSDISGYRIYRNLGEGTAFTNIGTTKANVLTYLDSTGTPGKTYSYFVRAVKGSDESVSSNTVKVSIKGLQSSPLTNIFTSQTNAPNAKNIRALLWISAFLLGALLITLIIFRKTILSWLGRSRARA